MPFDTIFFLFLFLPLSLLIYTIAKEKYKGFVLIVCSFFFYSFYSLNSAIQLLIYCFIVYALTLLFIKTGHKKTGLAIVVLLLVLYLIYYKYMGFIVENLLPILPTLGDQFQPKSLPLGISFFTFTAIAYVVDIYREKKEKDNFFQFLNYFTFFPKIVSGPIVLWKDFKYAETRTSDISYGIYRFVIGLTKKTVFSYYLGLSADKIWGQLEFGIDTTTAWIGALAYMLQLYFDFSGYSDMAIGISRMFGYSIGENFNFPYVSTSISEFWRRWHISLGTWFRKYIYFPLGGSRTGNAYVNLLIVFLVTGIWHGANWTFILWGVWHGVLRLIEKAVEKRKFYQAIPSLIKWFATMLAVMLGWVLFRSSDLNEGMMFLKTMFGMDGRPLEPLTFSWRYFLNQRTVFILIVGILSSTILGKTQIHQKIRRADREGGWIFSLGITLALAALMVINVMMIISSGHAPFIYFQF